jgi:outer membrane receptor protein involved in Fe transport
MMKKNKALGWLLCFGVILPAGLQAAEVTSTTAMGEITVTGTREAELKTETAATVGSIKEDTVQAVKPGHPSEIVERIPGVHLPVTGGEGHMTAIRQPITTKALYLYLEDGIPTRSTGFFNHNALYEVNVPQSGGIEVIKGPGSALHGSDAIGGVVNVLTKAPPEEAEIGATLEGGSYGWKRALLSTGNSWGSDGLRADVNITKTDGWRDSTGYDRQAFNMRWDHDFDGGAYLKTIAAWSNIDQQTAGSSRLLKDDYLNNPTVNYTPISLRKVKAFRFSTAYETETEDSLFSITPYARYNYMELLPNWSLSYDPQHYSTTAMSAGLLAKYRMDFKPMRARLIVGLDFDHTPGKREENAITVTKVGNIYTSYVEGARRYDYDVTFQGASPYVHGEISPDEKLRITAGVRFDHLSYDYTNNLTTLTTGNYRRPADTKVSYNHFSPKVGITYAANDAFNLFVSYRHAFRAPSEGQLFRQGKSIDSTGLKPVKVDSYEAGIRGEIAGRFNYDVSVYTMIKKDDILTFKHADGTRENMNGGKTSHEGVEVGLGVKILDNLDLNSAFSYAKHTYDDWRPNATTDYSGNEMESAPRLIVNTRLNYHPAFLGGGSVEVEWVKLGGYWMDQANTHKYEGHNLFNLRANYQVTKGLNIFGRAMNLADKRYATAATYKAPAWGRPAAFEYAPGMPRTFYAGVTYTFR